jgi:hypothetical protein
MESMIFLGIAERSALPFYQVSEAMAALRQAGLLAVR